MLRVAVIGLGNIARVHIPAIGSFEDVQLAAGCDINEKNRDILPSGVPFFTDYKRLLDEIKPDIVHICLPHYLHTEVARAALKRGIHVFTEKPVGLNVSDAKSLLGLEQLYGVKLGVCFQNRFNPSSLELMKRLKSGADGRITGIRGLVCWYRSPEYYYDSPWHGKFELAGGGCMINQSIHTLDLIQWFAGSPVTAVQGLMGNILGYDITVEDTAVANLDFENGVRGLYIATNSCYQDLPVEIDVQCEHGAYRIVNGSLYSIQNGKAEMLISDQHVQNAKACYGNSHVTAIRNFYDAVQGKKAVYVTLQEALKAQEIIEKIVKTSSQNIKINL